MEHLTELTGNEIAVLLTPSCVTLVTARAAVDDPMADRVATIAWAFPISHEPSMLAVSIRPQGSTAKTMRDSGRFIVNVLPANDECARIAALCGKKQGVDNRFAEAGLVTSQGVMVDAPRIEQCISWIECELVDSRIFGDHELFIGRTLIAQTKGTLDENGKLVPASALLMGQRGVFGHFEKGYGRSAQ